MKRIQNTNRWKKAQRDLECFNELIKQIKEYPIKIKNSASYIPYRPTDRICY